MMLVAHVEIVDTIFGETASAPGSSGFSSFLKKSWSAELLRLEHTMNLMHFDLAPKFQQ
jgi:hypothetical protein